MGTISLSLPLVGQTNASQEPLIPSDFTTLQTAINGNLDGANLDPSVTGRRLIAEARAFIGPSFGSNSQFFIAQDGSLVASAASSTKPLAFWYLNPADYAVVGAVTNAAVRISVATNGVAPAVTFAGQVNAITPSGSAGNIAFTIGGAALAGAGVVAPSGGTVSFGDSGTLAFSASPGGYAPVITLSGTTAANSATIVTFQLFVLNV